MLRQKLAQPARPFPQHAQYIKEIKKAKENGDHVSEKENTDCAVANPAHETRGGQGAKLESPVEIAPDRPKRKRNPDWEYGEIRNRFIQAKRGEGLCFTNAKALWDSSVEKRSYLGKVSVSELKKRRFIEKGVFANPWADA